MISHCGECQCGEKVTKITCDETSPRTDMVNYKYTGCETDSYTIFRCKKCSSVINDSWVACETINDQKDR
jgi:hypothetical protein